MARRSNRVAPSGHADGDHDQPGPRQLASSPQEAQRVLEMLDRTISAVHEDERRLRELLRAQIQAGQTQHALRILTEWDADAAGDVLKRHTDNDREEPG